MKTIAEIKDDMNRMKLTDSMYEGLSDYERVSRLVSIIDDLLEVVETLDTQLIHLKEDG
jgi:hypothetical protein